MGYTEKDAHLFDQLVLGNFKQIMEQELASQTFEKVIYDYWRLDAATKKKIVMLEVKQIIKLNPNLWLQSIHYGDFRNGAQTLILKFGKKPNKITINI